MCLPRIGDQNIFLFSQWTFYILQICFISFEIAPKSHSKKKNEWISDLALFAISSISWSLCHVSASFWQIPSIDLLFYLFQSLKASIRAQAQLSSSICLIDISKTIAPVLEKIAIKATITDPVWGVSPFSWQIPSIIRVWPPIPLFKSLNLSASAAF